MKTSKLEKLSHYAILGIAIIALVVSILQTQIQQRHNKLSVKPLLDYSLGQNFTDSLLTINIINRGFGPAIIKEIRFESEGKYYYSLEDYLKASGEIKNRRGSFNYQKNSVFSSQDVKLLLVLKGIHLRNVTVQLQFESIYEDKNQFTFKF